MTRQLGRLLQYLILLLSCVRLCSKTTPDITYIHQGKRCVKCAPGTYLIGHCVKEYEDARCRLCPDGTYSSEYNIATSCAPCLRTCQHRDLVQVTNCTHQRNMECACPEGKFNVNAHLDPFHAKCMDYGACGPGYGVKNKATSVLNTTCERCLVGKSYSSTTSASERCQICRDCGHFDVIAECNGTHNRICKEAPFEVVYPPQGSEDLPKKNIEIFIGVAIPVFIAGGFIVAVAIYFCKERLPWFRKQDNNPPNQVDFSINQRPKEYQMTKFVSELIGSPEPSSPVSALPLSVERLSNTTGQQTPYVFVGNPNQNLNRSDDVWSNSRVNIMMTLSEELINVRSWKNIIRLLYEDSGRKGSQADTHIKVTETNERHNLREQIYQCCYHWSLMPEASPNVLSQVLQKEDCKVILKVLRNNYPEVFRFESYV